MLFVKLSTPYVDKPNNMKNLAQKIKDYRLANGLSMQRLSELCGIPKDRLYKWEKGHVPYMTSETQKLIDLINTGSAENTGIDKVVNKVKKYNKMLKINPECTLYSFRHTGIIKLWGLLKDSYRCMLAVMLKTASLTGNLIIFRFFFNTNKFTV